MYACCLLRGTPCGRSHNLYDILLNACKQYENHLLLEKIILDGARKFLVLIPHIWAEFTLRIFLC